ncbi:hypothetical protein SYNPS1DRAFT_27876 [Syncephalis pseudoplumigaleata]|uniref:U2A'/phosphoprotein 32 family A C-terminal domain-containing protein n=1 Tax=Syncephalis pseudoplumigaleata TaxID=1712513 RepID=A0A4P9Z257_9FUNG|nr:hypothetical protein SYNPS1DRAFT_27876 [Syncephalis pseudoplumigaleata]|eukprot:RKP26435.1 hypothetical protein SYNPS1DRAFT_27876 [Syncephalis pseudoplumigaleata]
MDPTLRQLMRYRKPQHVRQLFLDNQRIPSIELLCYEPSSSSSHTTDAYSPLPRFVGLVSLSLTGVYCASLKHFPELPELRRLALADNRIAGGLEALVDKVPLLDYLDLSNNRISDFAALAPLRHMNKLRHLCLLDCAITKLPDYRAKIFEMLPSLHTLDGQDSNGQEVDSEEDDDDEEEDEEFVSESDEEESGIDSEEEEEEEEDEDMEGGSSTHASVEAILAHIQDGVYVTSDGEEIEVNQEALRRLIAKQRAAGLLVDEDEDEDDEEDEDYVAQSDSAQEDDQPSMPATMAVEEEEEEEEEGEEEYEIDQEISLDEEEEGEEEEEEVEASGHEEEEGPGLAYLLQTPSNSDDDDDEEDDEGWSPTKRKHEAVGEQLFGDEDEATTPTAGPASSSGNNADASRENGLPSKTKKPRC